MAKAREKRTATEVVEISIGANLLSDIPGGPASVSGNVGIGVAAGSTVGEAWWASGDTKTAADLALGVGIGLRST